MDLWKWLSQVANVEPSQLWPAVLALIGTLASIAVFLYKLGRSSKADIVTQLQLRQDAAVRDADQQRQNLTAARQQQQTRLEEVKGDHRLQLETAREHGRNDARHEIIEIKEALGNANQTVRSQELTKAEDEAMQEAKKVLSAWSGHAYITDARLRHFTQLSQVAGRNVGYLTNKQFVKPAFDALGAEIVRHLGAKS